MTATRIIDDHLELANIGAKTHAQIESHIQGIGNYAFPAADGAINKILQTDGAGVLSWVDLPAGFACGDLNSCNLIDIGTRAHSSLTGIGVSDHHTDHKAASAEDAQFKSVNIPAGQAYKQNAVNLISFNHQSVLFGPDAGKNLTTGINNFLIGRYAGKEITTASSNFFFGDYCGAVHASGQYNIFIGNSCGQHCVSGDDNILLGNGAGYYKQSGNHNIFMGGNSGFHNLIGSNNVFIGSNSGANNTGSSNVFIGYWTGKNETGSNLLYINNSATNIPLIWGDFTNHKVGIYMKPAVSKFGVAGIVEYVDNAAAVTAGLSVGEFYRTGDLLKIVH